MQKTFYSLNEFWQESKKELSHDEGGGCVLGIQYT